MAGGANVRAHVLVGITLIGALGHPAYAQDPDRAGAAEPRDEELARRIVSQSVRIEPGDVVVVAGGKHTIPLMEAIAIEAQEAGGLVTMFLTSDRVLRSIYLDVPERFLEQEPRYFAEWLRQIDVWIGLPGVEDFDAILAEAPETRLAKAAKADQLILDMLNDANVRGAFVQIPTAEQATNNGIEFARLDRMHWAALNADYVQIADQALQLKNLLEGAREVTITSPAGTDVSFSVGDRPIFVSDGVVTPEDEATGLFLHRWVGLPGGEVFFAPLETSANGKVVVPRTLCRLAPLTGASFALTEGRMTNFRAEAGEACVTETLAAYTGAKDRVGSVSVGLNPELVVVEEPGDFRHSSAAGMVWISLGQNQLLGGANVEPGGFEFPITDATVTVDGRVVVRDGQLAL